jgi:DNA-binding CsgD family transcriptional regulator
MLLGRDRERAEIQAALAQARSGESATLALVGEPGIGKTALLEYAAEHADGLALLRARGIESEAQIPFASLLELLRPALTVLDQIPEPQAIALEGALALRPGPAQERFAIGAATLSLLAAYTEQRPALVLIDDAQWLDGSSAQALLFAFRRLAADPVAVLIAAREGEPSLLDGADLPTLHIHGLTADEAAGLLDALPPESSGRLHAATAGNPLALLELASDPSAADLGPEGSPVLVLGRVAGAFVKRLAELDDTARRAVVLAATSDTGEIPILERAAQTLGIDLSALAAAETAGLIWLRLGSVEFRHPLARSAIYASASAHERREAHRSLAFALPDRDVDRRAWHFAAAAVSTDQTASAAVEHAAIRSRGRSAYATAAEGFERAARLAPDAEQRARLLLKAADAGWDAGFADRAVGLLDEARATTADPVRLVDIDALAGHIATRRGPVMRGYEILTAAADRTDGELAVAMLAEAASACFYAGKPREMVAVAERARAQLPDNAAIRARFLAAVAGGMADVVGGDAAAGASAIHEAIQLAERHGELQEDHALLPWLAVAPIFLREAGTGRSLLEHALSAARSRAAVSTLPLVLNLIARDDATTDRWMLAEASYHEAIELARETDQRTDLAFGLSGLAWLLARRGDEKECRACADEAIRLSDDLGTHLHTIWATAALGELALGIGDAAQAAEHFEHQQHLLQDLGITDPDLSPGPELATAYLRLGRQDEARQAAARFIAIANAKSQPWSLARALRCQGQLANDADVAGHFEQALRHHEQTPDAFEAARTRLAYGESLRRTRNRVLARTQLRAALETFERLGAEPWSDRTRAELAATGETLRRRDPTTIDELTPQELQIALLLSGGKTTREAASALFLSPKTIEYHLRHVYQKLDIHSRPELAQAFAALTPEPGEHQTTIAR